MNEQNLPKNTKKEVKETAVPVVSNDPQEVNNDSPPKLKEDTGSKGKTNSNEASKSDIGNDSQSSIQDNGGASLASEPFIDLLYNQIESVIGGENPNQFLCLTLPGQALTAKDFAYDYKNNAEKGPMVEANESRLANKLFDPCRVTGGDNGNIETTKKLMGHKSLKSTAIYADVLTNEKVKAVDNTKKAFRGRKQREENKQIPRTKRTAATNTHPRKTHSLAQCKSKKGIKSHARSLRER